MNSGLSKTINKFIQRAILALLAILVVTSAITIAVNTWQKYKLASAITESSRNNLLLADFRQAMITLNNGLGLDFLEIKYIDENNNTVFSVGDEPGSLWGLTSEFSIPVSLDRSSKSSHSLNFKFNVLSGLGSVLLIWVLITLAFVPIGRRLIKNIEESYSKDLKSQRLQELGRVSRQFAHDIRSPLTALKIFGEKFCRDYDPENKQTFRTAVQRIEKITEDVLISAKNPDYIPSRTSHEVEAAPKAVFVSKTSPVKLKPVLDEIIKLKRVELEPKNIKLKAYIDPQAADVTCQVNTSDFERVISNIINNASDAIEGPSGSITVSFERDNNNLSIILRDNGKGMDKDIIDHVFEEDFSYGKENGNGIGLSHAKHIIESWNGSVKLSSQPRFGTSVFLNLPLCEISSSHV